jgi:hypothetical protein
MPKYFKPLRDYVLLRKTVNLNGSKKIECLKYFQIIENYKLPKVSLKSAKLQPNSANMI